MFRPATFASASLGGLPSSGSIIASPLPKPGILALLFIGFAILAITARRRTIARRFVGCVAILAFAWVGNQPAAADPINAVSPGSLTVSDVITFGSAGSEPGNVVEGVFDPATEPGASFAEHFAGQTLGVSGDFDTLSGTPANPLTLVAGVANQNLSLFRFPDTTLVGLSETDGGHPSLRCNRRGCGLCTL